MNGVILRAARGKRNLIGDAVLRRGLHGGQGRLFTMLDPDDNLGLVDFVQAMTGHRLFRMDVTLNVTASSDAFVLRVGAPCYLSQMDKHETAVATFVAMGACAGRESPGNETNATLSRIWQCADLSGA